MARLPRLALPGHAHHVLLRALPGRPAFVDAADREAFLAALHEAARTERVAVHAWSLAEDGAQLLLTPGDGPALGRLVQAVGRRYVSAYNRRHGGAGTLWNGRFRASVVEPGAWRLAALLAVDGAGPHTSAAHRSGGARDPRLQDPPEVWALGNTPFDREAAYRRLLAEGLTPRQSAAIERAAAGGWVLGEAAFVAALQRQADRPVAPRPAGRPRRQAAGGG